MKVTITDWKLLAKIIWKLELWYQDNYRKLSNKKRKEHRRTLDKLTMQLMDLKSKRSSAKVGE